MRVFHRFLPLFPVLALAACEPVTQPEAPRVDAPDNSAVQEDGLTFVRFSPTALPATRDVSFWAVKGQDRQVVLDYAKKDGTDSGKRFLEFRVPADALLSRPTGEGFAQGDSVRISIHVDGERRFLFTFEPSGLRFNPKTPAELRVDYLEADPDYNDDGVLDARDDAFKSTLAVWRQEVTGDPWHPLSTESEPLDDRARADVQGFTRFALASN